MLLVDIDTPVHQRLINTDNTQGLLFQQDTTPVIAHVGSAVPHVSGEVAKLAFPKLWTSLQVTFLIEHFLLELRHIAFEGKSHLCESSQ